MTETTLSIVNVLLPSSALVLGVWLALRYFRLNAATRGAAWWIVVVLLMVMPVVWMTKSARISHDRPAIIEIAPSVAHIPTPEALLSNDPAPVSEPGNFITEDEIEVAATLLYFSVAACLLLRILFDYFRTRNLLRHAEPLQLPLHDLCASLRIRRPVRVLLSKRMETPVAVGFRHPAVVLPAALIESLSAEELRHVLIHELAHIARNDLWANLLGKVLQAICWPHPFVQFALRQIEAEREHACDDWVVHVMGGHGESANSYARSLVRLVELALARRQPILAATVIGQGPKVSQRVQALLDGTRNFAPRVSLVKFAWSIACLSLLVLICSQAPDLVAQVQEPIPVEEQAASPKAIPPIRPPAASPMPPAPPSPAGGEPQGFLASLAAAGYNDLSVDEIIELKNHGVDGRFIREMANNGWGKLSAPQLIQLRDHGVSAAYLREMHDAGIRGLTLEQAIELRNHGVKGSTIQEIHALGFGPYDPREVTEMSAHGIRPSFFQSLKQYGITQISAKDAIDAASHGLTGKNIEEARKFGPNLSFEQILKLKRAGVI